MLTPSSHISIVSAFFGVPPPPQGPLRHKLFKQVATMPMLDDMCPVNILVNNGVLFPSKLLSTKIQSAEATRSARNAVNADFDSVQDTVRGLASAMETPFSFMQHWSRKGNVSMEIAKKFPKDTVISLEPSVSRSKGHWDWIKKNKGPMNNIVCRVEPDTALLVKLLESPEVLRYQFLDWDYIQRFMNEAQAGEIILLFFFPFFWATSVRMGIPVHVPSRTWPMPHTRVFPGSLLSFGVKILC